MDPLVIEKQPKEMNLWGLGLTILVIIAIAFFIDIEALKVWVARAGVWGPLVFILLKISTIVIAPLGGSPLYPLVGLLFGFWPGILYVVLGDAIGYTTNFFLSRRFGRRLIARFISDKEDGLLAKIIHHVGTPKGFFHACLTMFAMPELLCYGAGLSTLPYRYFITIMVPIVAVGSAIFVFIGSVLSGDTQSILIGFGLPIIGALAMIIGGFLFSKSAFKQG